MESAQTVYFNRNRRLRRSEQYRALVRETKLESENFVAPLFVVPGARVETEISTLPGQFHRSVDMLPKEVERLLAVGINSVLLFGLPTHKDSTGSAASECNGLIQQAVREIKSRYPKMICGVDLCLCEYTSHGHCGILVGEEVDNDLTLEALESQALSLVDAGADIIAPSGMMDGSVVRLRTALDKNGFLNTLIMSYSAKYASAFYGPFRSAVDSTPAFGDRRGYQMDPANSDEALREVMEDIAQGADIVMIKPALSYLDIIRRVKEHSLLPVAAYNVSGEYMMIKAAAEKGLIDYEAAMLESLISIKRAGARIIITYFAKEAAGALGRQ